MELTVLLIFGAAVAASAAIIYFLMAIGMKEKTYEEAIAEQRRRPDDHLLLGRSTKDKHKEEKKVKKSGKKVKEKTEKADKAPQQAKKAHVVFVQPEAVFADAPRDETAQKKEIAKVAAQQSKIAADKNAKNKKDKENIPPNNAQPKKVEKPTAPAKTEKQAAPAKTEKQPAPAKAEKVQAPAKIEKQPAPAKVEKQAAPAKVEKQPAPAKAEKQAAPAKVEKQQAPAKAEKQAAPAKSEKQPAPAKAEKQAAPAKTEKQTAPAKLEQQQQQQPPPQPPAAAKVEKQEAPVKTEKPQTVVKVEKQQAAPQKQQNPGKSDKSNGPSNALKKKKPARPTELDVMKQIGGELERVNMNLIEPLLLKSDLSLSEIQQLIELLLNKQMASGVDKSEWIEGRQDPMVKLKRAHAEKEKALEKAQESLTGLNLRLKELSAERVEERTRSAQTIRALEEEKKLIKKKLEAIEENYKVDKVNLVNQIQQLQAKLTEDHVLIRKLKEDEGKVGELVTKIQHLDSLLAAEAQQHQNSRVTAENQLRQKEEEMQALRRTLIEEEKALHAQTEEKFKNFANSLQGLENHIKELTGAKDELERQIMASRQRESDALAEVAQLKDKLLVEHDKLLSQAAELQRLHEENQRLRDQRSDVPQLQNEVLQLRDENGALMSRLMAVTERPAAEGRENGDVAEEKHNAKLMSAQMIHEEALKEKDLEMEKLHEKVKHTEKLAAEVTLANTTVEKLKSEVNAQKTEILRLTEEVEAQRKKNDELRTKNYKVVDALSASEKMVQSKMQEMQTLVHETELETRLEEQKSCRELLSRVFPDITVEETTVHEQWLKKFTDEVLKHLAAKQSEPSSEGLEATVEELEKQNSQLKAMVNHYKTIIGETEGMLNRLQSHIEHEEAKWRQQLEAKEVELDAVKKERDQLQSGSNSEDTSESNGLEFAFSCIEKSLPPIMSEMQSQLKDLQNKLVAEEAEKRLLQTSCQKAQADLASVEALRERLAADVSKLEEEKQEAEKASRAFESQMEELRAELQKSKETTLTATQSVQSVNGATNGPASSDVTVSEKASKPRKITGWIKKKVGGKSPQQSPNLSAGRHDDFLSAEKAESS